MSKKFKITVSKDKFLSNLLPKSNGGITHFGNLCVKSTDGFKKLFKEDENIDIELDYAFHTHFSAYTKHVNDKELTIETVFGIVILIMYDGFDTESKQDEEHTIKNLEYFFKSIQPVKNVIESGDRKKVDDLIQKLLPHSRFMGYHIELNSHWKIIYTEGTVSPGSENERQKSKNFPAVNKKLMIWLAASLLLTSGSIVAYYVVSNKDIKPDTEFADQLYEDQNYEEALIEYEKIRNQINAEIPDEFQGDIYQKLGSIHGSIGQSKGDKDYYKRAESCWKLAIKKFEGNNLKRDYALIALSDVYFLLHQSSNTPKALDKIKICLGQISNENRLLTALKHRQLSLFFNAKASKKEDLDKSISHLLKAQDIVQNPNAFLNGLANSYIDRFHWSEDQNDIQSAYTIYKNQSRNITEDDKIGYAVNLFGVAHCEFHQGALDSDVSMIFDSRKKLKEALAIYENFEVNHYISSTLFTLGKTELSLYRHTKRSDHIHNAIDYVNQSKTVTNYNSPFDKIKVRTILGNAYYELSKHESEQINLERAIEELESIRSISEKEYPEIYIRDCGILASAYHKLGIIIGKNYKPEIYDIIPLATEIIQRGDESEIRNQASLSYQKMIIYYRETEADSILPILISELRMLAYGNQNEYNEAVEFNQQINKVLEMIP